MLRSVKTKYCLTLTFFIYPGGRHLICLIPPQDCKQLGFDTIELNAGTLKVPEETLLRFIRLIKTGGLKVRPQFAVKFDTADMPIAGDRAFGAYVAPVSKNSGNE